MKLLYPNNLFIGKVAKFLSSVDSTNLFAINLLAKTKPIEGTVIYTDNQIGGRGQIGSKWESQAAKNIIMSVILYPHFLSIPLQFKLNQIVALAVYDLLSNYIFPLDQLSIKWPNDIYIGDNKMGGILIENKLKNSLISESVIGIGLNVNQTSFSSELPNPTSLLLETGLTNDRFEMLERLCEFLEHRYLQLKSLKRQNINDEYLQVLYGYQEWRDYEITSTKNIIRGRIVGLTKFGKLQIQTSTKQMEFSLKEISFLF
ncbi:MAG: biotin--[acetyl-CoA-carboxylase] ligase [Saprospiraceae bacterium]|nr:biotin--[acetyl-CoA-carboxylase] ligase [Saprospiraceae bacterium]